MCTRSSATEDKQRVSCACLSKLANWSCNSPINADVQVQYTIQSYKHYQLRKCPTYVADEAFQQYTYTHAYFKVTCLLYGKSLTYISKTIHRHLSSVRFFTDSYEVPSHMLLISCSAFLRALLFPNILPSSMSLNSAIVHRGGEHDQAIYVFAVLSCWRYRDPPWLY